jgi:proton-dependent oligopeptide transporter, POT family
LTFYGMRALLVLMGVWFLAVTAGDCTTGLLCIAGVDLSGVGIIALESAVAAAAGVAIHLCRRKVVRLMGDVH